MLKFTTRVAVTRFGLKGPGAPEWMAAQGIAVPNAANTWAGATHTDDDAIFTARLGTGEFFLEDRIGGTTLKAIEPNAETHPPGVYPVLREDAAFILEGRGAIDVLAQVCSFHFAELTLESRPVIMTSMIGVSVLIAPQDSPSTRQYRIWCDPTFGTYLGESLHAVVHESGGNHKGVSTP